MQPQHKLALHHVRQGDSLTASASDPHSKLVELAVGVRILEVLVMSLLLPRNACTTESALCKCISKTEFMQSCIRLPVR